MYNGYRTHTVGPRDNYHNNTAYLETLLSLSLSFPVQVLSGLRIGATSI